MEDGSTMKDASIWTFTNIAFATSQSKMSLSNLYTGYKKKVSYQPIPKFSYGKYTCFSIKPKIRMSKTRMVDHSAQCLRASNDIQDVVVDSAWDNNDKIALQSPDFTILRFYAFTCLHFYTFQFFTFPLLHFVYTFISTHTILSFYTFTLFYFYFYTFATTVQHFYTFALTLLHFYTSTRSHVYMFTLFQFYTYTFTLLHFCSPTKYIFSLLHVYTFTSILFCAFTFQHWNTFATLHLYFLLLLSTYLQFHTFPLLHSYTQTILHIEILTLRHKQIFPHSHFYIIPPPPFYNFTF